MNYVATQDSAGQPSAWIPTPGDRGLRFTLRVYRPAPALQSESQRLAAPQILREGAC